MLKNTCKTLTAGLRRHWAACLGLLAGLAALGLFAAARGNRAAMDWWLAHVSMPVKWGISALVDPLPFSACELGATVLIVGALAFLVRAIRRAVKAKKVPCPPGCCMWRCWSSGLCGRVRPLGHPVLRYKLCRQGRHAVPGGQRRAAGGGDRLLRRPRQRDSRCRAPGRKRSVCGGENRNFAKLQWPVHAVAGALAVFGRPRAAPQTGGSTPS